MRGLARVPTSRSAAILAWVAGLLLIAIVWAMTFLFLRVDRAATIEAAVRENQNRAVAFEQYVTRTLDTANVAAEHLSFGMRDLLARRRDGLVPQPLADPIANNPLFAAVLVADAQGNVVYSTVPRARPLNLGATTAFRRFRDNVSDASYISRPVRVLPQREPIFSVVRPIRDEDGRLLGAVDVQTSVGRLTAFNEGARIRPLDLISVIRLDGVTLARRTGSRVSSGENVAGKLVMIQQHANPNGTYLGPSALDGQKRYFSHRRLKSYPVFVTVGVGERDVLAPVREQARWFVGAAAALTAAIVALALILSFGARRGERAAERLREANRRFDLAQRMARIGDWIIDPETRRVGFSPALCEMYGCAAGEDSFPLEDVLAYFEPEGRERVTRAIDAALATGEKQLCEVVSRVGPGAPSPRRLVFTPVPGRDGAPASLTATDQDISQERLNARLRDEVAHSSRVESMNLMAVTLAHELAQPLTAAANYMMVARIQSDGGEVGDALAKAGDQIALAQEIMRRARDMLSRRLDAEESASIAAAVQDAVALVRVADRRSGVDIEVDAPPPELRVAANKVQVQQVVMNLLRNAIDAAGQGPRGEGRVAVTVDAQGETVLVCITDNGPGFAAAMDDPFAPFAGGGAGGLGLGLSISRAIVETYGGAIWFEPGRESGSAVCFRLPRAG